MAVFELRNQIRRATNAIDDYDHAGNRDEMHEAAQRLELILSRALQMAERMTKELKD